MRFSSNFEGFFDDPYGTGEAAYQTVRGMQDSGVLSTAKHYIGYEQETFRYVLIVSLLKVLPDEQCAGTRSTSRRRTKYSH